MSRPVVRAIVLDTAALSALARGSGSTMARLSAAHDMDVPVVFPAVVLAEIMTGGPADAAVWRIVNRISPIDITVGIASHAGRLRENAESVRRKKRDLTVDAVVAASALELAPCLLVTGDPDDMILLTAGSGVKVVRA